MMREVVKRHRITEKNKDGVPRVRVTHEDLSCGHTYNGESLKHPRMERNCVLCGPEPARAKCVVGPVDSKGRFLY